MSNLYVVRLSGPADLSWSGIGENSIGICELPLRTVIKLKPFNFRRPSADGPRKESGSKLETVKLGLKTSSECLSDLQREFYSLKWKAFDSRGEAQSFLETGQSDRELFGLTGSTTQEELKAKYRALAAANHPDLFMNAPSELLEEQTRKLAAINSAYERLTAPDKN